MAKKQRKTSRGRPAVIREATVIATYNVTIDQKDWLAGLAAQRGLSASDVLREILQREMEKDGLKTG